MGLEELDRGDILVPTEKVVELVKGAEKRTSHQRKFYPGYVLINMEMNDQKPGTW